MFKVSPNTEPLEAWPAMGLPNYTILHGNPVASGLLQLGKLDSQIRVGIWRCTEGTFECVEAGDELQTIIKGKLRITDPNGTTHEFIQGDSFFTRKGEKMIWDIVEPVEKIFFTYNTEGTTEKSHK